VLRCAALFLEKTHNCAYLMFATIAYWYMILGIGKGIGRLPLSKGNQTMPYIQNDMFLSAGYELEISGGGSYSIWDRKLKNAGFDWVLVKYDATPVVDAEIVIPPFPAHMAGGVAEDLRRLFAFIDENGGKVNRRDLGGHVHIGNRAIKNMTPAYYWEQSKQLMRDREAFYMPSDDCCADIMPLILAKDVAVRYADNVGAINGILPPSRRDNRYARCLTHIASDGRRHADFMAATNANEMSYIIGGKFYAVNLETWTRGTIEFRQHQATMDIAKLEAWCLLLDAMFRHSDRYRVDYDADAVTSVSTPAQPYRAGSRIGVMWSLIRRDDGATTREIADATGWTAQTIRARISEMRREHGEQAVICHTQQAYGHSYGSSNGEHNLNGYMVPATIERRQRDNGGLLPENQRGVSSIWAGLDDETFEYFNTRRDQLN
jgi:hypothetical protein